MNRVEFNPIDFHVHHGPSYSLGYNVSIERINREMEEAGIKSAAIMNFPSHAEARDEANEIIVEICEEHEKFHPIFCLNKKLRNPDERFAAVKWHWIGGVPDSKSNFETLQRDDLEDSVDSIADLDLPVIFEEELEFTESFVEKFPEIKLVIPHLGGLGGNPLSFLESFKEKENVYFDTSLGAKRNIEKFIATVGCERILFGSDLPFGYMNSEIEKILSLDLDARNLELILNENAERLLKTEI